MKYYLLGVLMSKYPIPSLTVFGILGLIWFMATSHERSLRIRKHYGDE